MTHPRWAASARRTRPLILAAVTFGLFLIVGMQPGSSSGGGLQGFDPRFINIDDTSQVAAGADEYVNLGASAFPAGPGGSTYIDWAHFFDPGNTAGLTAANFLSPSFNGTQATLGLHRLGDYNTASPGSDDQIGASGKIVTSPVLAKQDITQLYISNNVRYLYIGEERRANNGDSMWMMFFNDGQPTINSGGALILPFTFGDLAIVTTFPGGSAPANYEAYVFRYTGVDQNLNVGTLKVAQGSDCGLTNFLAIGFTLVAHRTVGAASCSGLGTINAAVIPALSVNQVPTPAPPWGIITGNGVYMKPGSPNINLSNPNATPQLDTANLYELAIDLHELSLDGQQCGLTRFVTALTRPSHSFASDLKDLAGPVSYSFGNAEAKCEVTDIACTDPGTNTATVTVHVTASGGPSGTYNITPPTDWSCDSGTPGSGDEVIFECSGPVAVGTHSVSFGVEDAEFSDCGTTAECQVTVPAAIGLSLSSNAPVSCVNCVDFTASPTGGVGPFTYVWKVDGVTQVGKTTSTFQFCFPSSELCGTRTISVVATDSNGCHSASKSKTIEKTTTITEQ